MPEGDSIYRIAEALRPRLVGKTLERVTTQGLIRGLAGKTVTAVTAHGKHLVIELADGTHVRAHLGMYGRHRAYGRTDGEATLAKLSPGRVSLAIVTADTVDLWLGARTIEISDRRAPLHGQAVAALGPDVLSDGFDPEAAATRAAGHPTRRLADVLLDQRVAAGIGNVYKSEVLFLRGLDPRRLVGTVDRATLADVYATARELMLENLGDGPRTTAPGPDRFYVYSRTGKPCRRCGTPVEAYQLGDPPRWTWSCATCQPRFTIGAGGGGGAES